MWEQLLVMVYSTPENSCVGGTHPPNKCYEQLRINVDTLTLNEINTGRHLFKPAVLLNIFFDKYGIV